MRKHNWQRGAKQISFCIEGLDALLQGGVPEGYSVLIEGPPGSGKTTIGLQYICCGAVQEGEAGAYITFEELPEQLHQDALHFGWDLSKLEKEDKVKMLCTSPSVFKEELEKPGGMIDRWIYQSGVKRVVIDSINHFNQLTDMGTKLSELLERFMFGLKRRGVTALFIKDRIGTGVLEVWGRYSADVVIDLFYDEMECGKRCRFIEVTKLRSKPMLGGRHFMAIGNSGIRVFPLLHPFPEGAKREKNLPKGSTMKLLFPPAFRRGDSLFCVAPVTFGYPYLAESLRKQFVKVGVIKHVSLREGKRDKREHFIDPGKSDCGQVFDQVFQILEKRHYKNIILWGFEIQLWGEERWKDRALSYLVSSLSSRGVSLFFFWRAIELQPKLPTLSFLRFFSLFWRVSFSEGKWILRPSWKAQTVGDCDFEIGLKKGFAVNRMKP